MKKVLFAALAACGFIAANAQAASDNSNANINVTIVKTVEISPSPMQNSFDVIVDEPAEFGKQLPMSAVPRNWVINSTDPGNYTIEFFRGTIPAAVELSYDLFENLSAINSQTAISTGVNRPFAAGAGFGVSLKMYSKVPWGVAAGTYAGKMIITATAN